MSHSKNCLILEDNPARYPYLISLMFQLSYPFMTRLIVVTTARAAKEELSRHPAWNVIMLDHDLDGEVYVDSDKENTGYQVAKFIARNNVRFETLIIHTLNAPAVPKIMDVLKGSSGQVFYKPCVELFDGKYFPRGEGQRRE